MFCLYLALSIARTNWNRAKYEDDICQGQINVIDVLFINQNSGVDNGGAISIRGCTGTLTMDTVTFQNCVTRSTGAAIFLECNKYDVNAQKVCVYKCSTDQNCQYAQFTSSQGSFQHTLTSIADCTNYQGATVFQTKSYKTPSISNWNISLSATMKSFSYMMEQTPTISYFNFQNCPCYNGFTIGWTLKMNYANFVDNTIQNRYMMYLSGASHFQYCFFKNNNGYFAHTQSLTLTDCYFDQFLESGPNLQLTRCQTSGEVFPTNFDIYAADGCKAVPYVGEQPPAPENPPATPMPTRSPAPTNWPEPTATPIPPSTGIQDYKLEYQFITSTPKTISSPSYRILVHDCIFFKFNNAVPLVINGNVKMRLEMWETSFYNNKNTNAGDSSSGGFAFYPSVSDPWCSVLVNRTCGYLLNTLHSCFAYTKCPSKDGLNHVNLSSITQCGPESDGADKYNTVHFESGQRIFNSWNSSDCTVTDTAGIYTRSSDKSIAANILYATFFNNHARKYMVLNCANTKIIYSHINVIDNKSDQGELFLAAGCDFKLDQSYIFGNKVKDNKMLTYTPIGNTPIASDVLITNCFIQSNLDTAKCTLSDCLMTTSMASIKLTHFANQICKVQVSAQPLAPAPTFMTRCMQFDASEPNKKFLKVKSTKVGMALAASGLTYV